MLYIIGLGLFDEKDITVRGLETVRACKHVFLENYTSILHVPVERLQEYYGCEAAIVVADREMVESEAERILDRAKEEDVAFLVVGDPFGATTHADLLLRARARGIAFKVIHNASIMNAVAACGLQLYSFGQTISIPFYTSGWRPRSFYHKIHANQSGGSKMHTLCLLDIKVKEQSDENLFKGRKIYEPPRFMTANQAIEQLLECEEEEGLGCCRPDSIGVAMARVGAADQIIMAGTLEELVQADLGKPLHALVLPGPEVHELEFEMLRDCFAMEGSVLKSMNFTDYKAKYHSH